MSDAKDPKDPIWKPPAGPLSEDQRVQGIRRLLDGASPTVRRAAISLALDGSLSAARRDYAKVYDDGEQYKAQLIRANGMALRESAERLDAGLELLTDLLKLSALAVQAAGEVEVRQRALGLAMAQLAAVCGPWRDTMPGIERGEGLSQYDNAEGVAAIKEQARRLHEAYLRRRERA